MRQIPRVLPGSIHPNHLDRVLVEKRKYLLPQAIAIHVKHLRAILEG